jgi:hypothetical protein
MSSSENGGCGLGFGVGRWAATIDAAEKLRKSATGTTVLIRMAAVGSR